MFLEFDWTFNVYRPRLGHTFISVRGERSWSTMSEAREALAIAGLAIGRKVASRSWAIDLAGEARS